MKLRKKNQAVIVVIWQNRSRLSWIIVYMLMSLTFQNTSAREVVMLALQEFGITEYSSNYTLCEVKVDVSS